MKWTKNPSEYGWYWAVWGRGQGEFVRFGPNNLKKERIAVRRVAVSCLIYPGEMNWPHGFYGPFLPPDEPAAYDADAPTRAGDGGEG